MTIPNGTEVKADVSTHGQGGSPKFVRGEIVDSGIEEDEDYEGVLDRNELGYEATIEVHNALTAHGQRDGKTVYSAAPFPRCVIRDGNEYHVISESRVEPTDK